MDADFEGPKCALVPLNGPVTVTATGLRWPLSWSLPDISLTECVDKHALKFDGLISTSNCIINEEVVVESSGPVLWMTKLKDGLDD